MPERECLPIYAHCGLFTSIPCRYETEDNPEVCASMERIANGFLAEMDSEAT